MNQHPKSYFILFEGCDCTGKTSQSKLIAESGIFDKVEAITFPDRSTKIGSIIDQYLKKEIELNDQAIHLLYTANRWELSDKIKNLLATGTSIVCDRYWYSGCAYSVAKGLSIEWCSSPEKGLPEPDLIIFLDADPKILAERKGYGTERYERIEFQQRVRDAFYEFKKNGNNWVVIDASKPFEEVHNDILQAIQQFVDKH